MTLRLNWDNENWEPVFNNSDINTTFYVFLNIFLRYFYSSFPLIQRQKYKPNLWIMIGIIVSCRGKEFCMQKSKK
jgi:hypothetical protein